MNVTEKIARFIVETKSDQVPQEAIEVAKGAMRDCLGVTLAAVNEDASKAIIALVQELGGNAVSSVMGAGFKTSPELAALANGTMSHALDYDDVTPSMAGHPSVPVLPAVLAAGEYVGASGLDAVAAYVVGYEVETKLGRAIASRFYDQGWHPTAVLGTMGAVAASARLLGLSVEQCISALGIASSQASGLRQNFGTHTKPFHAGNAARSGVLAAMLARKGFTADLNIIDGPQGFLSAFGERDKAKPGPLLEGLGNPWDITTLPPAIKYYPCCAATHRALDAILGIVNTQDIQPSAVASILCSSPARVKISLIRSDATSGLEGKFCMEYVLSSAIVDKSIGMRTFDNEAVKRPQVKDLMKKFVWDLREVGAYQASVVTLKMNDGREFSKSVLDPTGSPTVPLTTAQLVEKYCDCARYALPEDAVQKSSEMLANLEGLANIRLLTDVVGKKG